MLLQAVLDYDTERRIKVMASLDGSFTGPRVECGKVIFQLRNDEEVSEMKSALEAENIKVLQISSGLVCDNYWEVLKAILRLRRSKAG